jgi:hypothetical protein
MHWSLYDWQDIPEMRAILDRAQTYRRSALLQSHRAPERFLLTPEESRTVQGFAALYEDWPDRLFGMRVQHPKVERWIPPDRRAIRHVPYSAISAFVGDVMPATATLAVCETTLPPCIEDRYLLCPCGEVIWDVMPSIDRWRAIRCGPYIPSRQPQTVIVSDEVSDEAWEDAVNAMIGEAQARRGKR